MLRRTAPRSLLGLILVLCLAALAGVTALTTTAAQAAVRRPDLSVTGAQAPAQAAAGARVTLKATVRNGGTAAAGGSTLTFALSQDQKAGRDLALKPSKATPRIKPRRTWTGSVAVTLPATVAAGRYYVIACADATRKVREKSEGNNCRTTAAVQVTAPASTQDLIDADLASGKLTPEQALTYKVFADFGDGRLPSKYAGGPDSLQEGSLTRAAEEWPTLSATTQDVLRPFLVPPFYAGSHWTPGEAPGGRTTTAAIDAPWCSGNDGSSPVFESWDHVETVGGEYRIWWLKKNPGDAAQAAHMVSVLESTIIPELTSLMGRGPKPDGNGPCDGGSPATDIAMVDAATATVFGDGGCGADGVPTHMIWPRTKPAAWAGTDPYLAHEVMHTIQFAMPQAGSCSDYEWLREATAQWTQDYVTDPAYGVGLGPDDTEFEAAPHFLDAPNTSLDVHAPITHAYGAYLLFQWAARKGGPSFVPEVWANAATMKPTQAINAALPGDGFVDTWADFALSNYNRAPVDDYKVWDQLQHGAKLVGPEVIPLDKPRNPTIDVSPLAAQYLELDISDRKISELEVTNNLAGDDHAKLRAVVTYDDGSSKIIDLSVQAKNVICIDTGSKRAVKVVLIFSNSHQTDAKHFAPTLVGKDQCGCPNSAPRAASAEGVCEGGSTINFSWSHENTRVGPNGGEVDTTESGSGSVTLDLIREDSRTYVSAATSRYSVDATRTIHVPDDDCPQTRDSVWQGAGTLPEGATFTAFDPDSDKLLVSNSILMEVLQKDHVVTCDSDYTEQMTSYLLTPECKPTPQGGNVFWEFKPVAPDSHTYSYTCTGTVEYDDGGGHHKWTKTVSGTLALP